MHCGNKSKICFLTSHTEQARFGYKVNAFRYIDKKHLEEIDEALDSYLKTKIQDRIISCDDTAGIRIRINLNELLLVETYGRKLRYLMLDGREHFCVVYAKMMSFVQRVFSYFLCCDINKKYGNYPEPASKTLQDSEQLHIYRSYQKRSSEL